MVVGVDLNHLLETQTLGNLLAHGRADQSLGIFRHKIDVFRGRKPRGADHIALVLAVFVVGDQDDLALSQVFERLLDGVVLLHKKASQISSRSGLRMPG